MSKSTDRRTLLHEAYNPADIEYIGEPIELPVGAVKPQSISQEIQKQIAIELAKKQIGADQQTPDQIYAELMDLDEDESFTPTSQYEYTDMQSEILGDELPADEPFHPVQTSDEVAPNPPDQGDAQRSDPAAPSPPKKEGVQSTARALLK